MTSELYQQLIIDHARHPHNFGELPVATNRASAINPLCGDKIQLAVRIKDDVIAEATFVGTGCAISLASASLMTDAIKNKSPESARKTIDNFLDMLASEKTSPSATHDERLAVFENVREFPARVKCATMAWHTLRKALDREALA